MKGGSCLWVSVLEQSRPTRKGVQNWFFSETVFGGFYLLLWLFDGERPNVHFNAFALSGRDCSNTRNPRVSLRLPWAGGSIGLSARTYRV